MLKKWLTLFRKDNLLHRAYQQSFEMLDITRAMYDEAKESLRQREDSEVDLKVKEIFLPHTEIATWTKHRTSALNWTATQEI
jgi:hypothetical protein